MSNRRTDAKSGHFLSLTCEKEDKTCQQDRNMQNVIICRHSHVKVRINRVNQTDGCKTMNFFAGNDDFLLQTHKSSLYLDHNYKYHHPHDHDDHHHQDKGAQVHFPSQPS